MSNLINQMSKDLLMRESVLLRLAISAPRRYKVYSIDKRRGDGTRIIAQPAREVKALQRWMIENVLEHLPVHKSATAYRKGSSIKKNARRHATRNCILKMDIQEFFPSITPEDLFYVLGKNQPELVDEEDFDLMANILFWRPGREERRRLSIGAPSSPILANAIMYEFDRTIASGVCREKNLVYTRYADDMIFSGESIMHLRSAEAAVRKTLDEIERPRLRLNGSKTVYVTKKHRRFVTGLVLSNDGWVSLGRDRKREIRAKVHRFIKQSEGKLGPDAAEMGIDEILSLYGLLAFAQDVEPDFVNRLKAKYGDDFLDDLKKIHKRHRARSSRTTP